MGIAKFTDDFRTGDRKVDIALKAVDLLGGVDDPVTLAAALLHDTIEDTGSMREELAGMFGEDVASVVVEVTDDKHLAKAARKREQIRHALELTPRARVIKLADKLYNLDHLTRTVLNG